MNTHQNFFKSLEQQLCSSWNIENDMYLKNYKIKISDYSLLQLELSHYFLVQI